MQEAKDAAAMQAEEEMEDSDEAGEDTSAAIATTKTRKHDAETQELREQNHGAETNDEECCNADDKEAKKFP